ncbi:MAG: ATP-binding protein, partial [Kordiimonas sp.]
MAPIRLVQETGDQASFLLVGPIYENFDTANDVGERRLQILGYVSGVFRAGDLIQDALKDIEHKDIIDLHIQDKEAPAGSRTLFGSETMKSKWLNAEEVLEVGGRRWHLSFVPKETFYAEYIGEDLWAILAGSLTFSTLCSLLILIVTGRNSLMHRLVNERTSELLTAQRYVEGISESAPGLLSYIGADLCYKFVNKSYERWFGLPRDTFIGQHIKAGISKKTWEIAKPQVEAALAGEVAQFEVNLPYKDRGERYTHVTYTPDFNDRGGVDGFFVAVEDMTTVKRSEEELQAINQSLEAKNEQLIDATKKAESATRMKSEFLAVMSHEIRTPMNGIMGTTDLLLETELSGTQRKYAKTTMSSAEALLGLINDILDFSKIEAGKLSLEEVPFDMQHVAEDVVDMIARKCDANDVELLLDYAPGTARHVLGDPGRVRQILLNLMSNAVKFTSKGYILMRIQSRSGDNGDLEFRVEVKDTGIGIPEDKHDTIFNKFDQADQSTTRKYGGTGLGLSICQRLTSMMGGHIGLDSEEGKGSTFWFTMSLKASDDYAPVNEDMLVDGGLKGSKLLIVDDNEVARKILREQLKSKQAEVSLVENAKQALDGLRSDAKKGKPFDIAIVDYRMPGMDGKALVQAIKADDTIKDTAIVMITSSPVRGDGVEMHDLGVAGYLVKPTRAIDVGRVLHFIWDMKK